MGTFVPLLACQNAYLCCHRDMAVSHWTARDPYLFKTVDARCEGNCRCAGVPLSPR